MTQKQGSRCRLQNDFKSENTSCAYARSMQLDRLCDAVIGGDGVEIAKLECGGPLYRGYQP